MSLVATPEDKDNDPIRQFLNNLAELAPEELREEFSTIFDQALDIERNEKSQEN